MAFLKREKDNDLQSRTKYMMCAAYVNMFYRKSVGITQGAVSLSVRKSRDDQIHTQEVDYEAAIGEPSSRPTKKGLAVRRGWFQKGRGQSTGI